ncbi:MAG: hypothetical protein BWY84_00915 [Candidatus Aerophobetes bacterium ADurb.Bin490]|nr:MAG: hypothetical protein BWY84_00915 [Candidatus Aerophobetes bacterium ADurb.Bin490]
MNKSTTPTSAIALGWANISPAKSCPRLASETALVTMIPVPTDNKSAGIWVTRPSPIVSTVYLIAASPSVMPWNIMPMKKPAMILIRTITMAAMASPLTNLLAPSMDP